MGDMADDAIEQWINSLGLPVICQSRHENGLTIVPLVL